MSRISRRRFLEDSLLAAAAAAAASSTARAAEEGTGRKAAPSDVLRVAVVGVNSRGMAHVNGFGGRKDTQVVAICDADEKTFEKARRAVEQKSGKSPAYVQDIRKLLEDKSIDIISVATP